MEHSGQVTRARPVGWGPQQIGLSSGPTAPSHHPEFSRLLAMLVREAPHSQQGDFLRLITRINQAARN